MTADFLVIGGGIIGLTIARELRRRHPDCKVALLEKEKDVGQHASGRNSGILHAGFYYTSDSLKARFTRQGNIAMTAYCEARRIPLRRCGKLVVARDEREIPILDELLKRAKANDVPLEAINDQEARRIEPRLRTHRRALFSPSTSSVDPSLVVQAMKQDALDDGVDIRMGVAYLGKNKNAIRTSAGVWEAGYVINAAGLFADLVARDFGFSRKYRILPFKGLYLCSDEPAGSVRTNVYPVPDLRNPFLGVHFTVAAGGSVKIGPTAIPVFWREQYRLFDNFRLLDFIEIGARNLKFALFSRVDYKRLAMEELAKYSRAKMVRLAGMLMDGVKPEKFTKWGAAGIRAQLVDTEAGTLEMDFVVEGDAKSMHVLNVVSPGFTCSIPFAAYVCDRIDGMRELQDTGSIG